MLVSCIQHYNFLHQLSRLDWLQKKTTQEPTKGMATSYGSGDSLTTPQSVARFQWLGAIS
jgi:hypothetical protein